MENKDKEQRVIKVRAWNEGSEEMWDYDKLALNRVHLSVTGNGFISHDEDGALELLPYLKPMQFTGLTDKEGKEIYEGDFFMVDGVKLVVVFEDGKFCFDNTGGSYGRDFIGQDRVSRLTIAGNIYQSK